MKPKTAFVSDFDGTITDDDFFAYATQAFFDDKALEPWRRFKAGKQTHFSALKEMFAKIRVPQEELDNFMRKIPVDKGFIEAAQICKEKDIPFYICSAGCDYYINFLIGDILQKYNITLVTNHGEYSQKQGLMMYKPEQNSPYYDENTGISKAAIVQKLHREGYEVIYAGDGLPDYEAAWNADVVFARRDLLVKCLENGVKAHPFKDFGVINAYLKEL